MASIPLAVIWLNVDSILLLLGQNEGLATIGQNYSSPQVYCIAPFMLFAVMRTGGDFGVDLLGRAREVGVNLGVGDVGDDELATLDDPKSLDLLRRVFTDPLSFKPTITPENVTEDIAKQFSALAQSSLRPFCFL